MDVTSTDIGQLPDHLVRLPGTEWGLWRWVAVRGAGFPASLPDALAAPASTALADRLLDADTADSREAFARAFASDIARVTDALCGLASKDRFREAVLWQNRHAVETALDPLLNHHRARAPRRSQQRQHEELVANYLQRYCLKDETIGFFGPVAWARVADEAPALDVQPGRQLLASRTTYFEVWGIDALADALTQDGQLDLWLAPRRHHTIHLEGTTLLFGGNPPVELSAADAALLHACDGEQTVRAIADTLMADDALELRSEQDVLQRLRALRDRGLIVLRLDVPMELHPDRVLERQLHRIGDEPLRARSVDVLHELQQARDRVSQAVGNAEALAAALDDLDTRFTRATGRAPTRSHGRTYAARTLVYEDCRRDLDLRIGTDLIASAAEPLALLLASARWLTADTARRYAAALSDLHRDLTATAGAGDGTIGFATFLDHALPLVLYARDGHARQAQEAFHARWARVLDVPDGQHTVTRRAAQLRPRVESCFDASAPGWLYARYHSPDIHLCAHSVEDVQRGDYLLVLGELHVGANTLGTPLFVAEHPCVDDLWCAIERELTEPRLVPVIPKNFWPGQGARLLPALFSSRDIHVALSTDPPPTQYAPATRPVGAFVVVRDHDRLVVRIRDGAQTFDLVGVVAQALTWQVMSRFSLLSPSPHRPRIVIDRLVVARECWSFAPEEMPFARERDEAARFLAARRFVRAHGLPRWVFVKAPLEKKPIYVDFTSPTYVNILSRLVRRSLTAGAAPARVTVTEMLPRADQAWLTDADGTRYSSELRLVAVDLAPGFVADERRTSAHA